MAGSSMMPGNKVETHSRAGKCKHSFLAGSGKRLYEKTKWKEGRIWAGELYFTQQAETREIFFKDW